LILLIAEFNDGALHRFHTGFLKQPIKVIKTTLLGAKGDPNSGELTVARLTDQALTALGQITRLDPCRIHAAF